MLRSASRWVLRRAPGSKGKEPSMPPEMQQPHRPMAIITTDETNLVPHRDKLLVFRSLTGIDTVPAISTVGLPHRAAPNLGIYPRVVKAEKKASRSFRVYNAIVNFCLGTQIVVAAALTAIGAADGSRAAVTVFGAINTIIAGFLTYLKGSGMPQQLKYVQDQFKTVRELIEQREREFCLADCPLDPIAEAAAVDELYQTAKQDSEGGNKTGGGGNGGRGGSQLSKMTATVSSALGHKLSKLAEPSDSTRVVGPEKV